MSISYLVHVSILIAIFYGLYILLLSRETYFKINRALLILGIFASFLLPFIPTPVKLSMYGQQIETQTNIKQSIDNIITTPANKPSVSISLPHEIEKQTSDVINLSTGKGYVLRLIPIIYLIGVLVLLINLLIQLFNISLKIFKYRSPSSNIVSIPNEISPCSFFGFTLIQKDMQDGEIKEHVLMHENVHNQQWHSIDIFLAELMVVMLWFNPFAWMYRRSIESNLEYLADDNLVQQNVEKKNYQYNLLQLAVPNFPLSIVTNYNQSLIKKRITMMNSKKSSAKATWKYLLFLPVAIFSITLFNPTSLDGLDSLLLKPQKLLLIITANTSLNDLTRLQAEVRKYNYTLSVNDVSWNDDQTLKMISAELNTGIQPHNMKVEMKYNDINKSDNIAMYIGSKGSGSSAGGCNDVESIKSSIEGIDESGKDFIVLASFLDKPMKLEDFSKSNVLENNSALFNKESNWAMSFFQDIERESEKNIYLLDQEITNAKNIAEILPLRKLEDVIVKEDGKGTLTYNFITIPHISFMVTGSSSVRTDDGKDYLFESTSRILKESYLHESEYRPVNFYLDGVLTKYTLETIDTALVKNIEIQSGESFNIDGEHLGKEIRVLFKSI